MTRAPDRGYSKCKDPEAVKGFPFSWYLWNGVLKTDYTLGRGKRIFWNKQERDPTGGTKIAPYGWETEDRAPRE